MTSRERPPRPTPAQVAANRKNAKRSTGPKTAQGKERSRANALKHGIYAHIEVAVDRGPFAEDADEVHALLAELTQDLAPRDLQERLRARQIAMLQLQERRVDAREAALLQQVRIAQSTAKETQANRAIEEVREHVAEWNAERMTREVDDTGTGGIDRPWELMALWLRGALGGTVRVKDLWDSHREPKDPDEWYRAFRAIARSRFPDPVDLAALLMRHQGAACDQEELQSDQDRRQAAQDSLRMLDECNQLRSRLANQLMKQFAMYSMLQSRTLES